MATRHAAGQASAAVTKLILVSDKLLCLTIFGLFFPISSSVVFSFVHFTAATYCRPAYVAADESNATINMSRPIVGLSIVWMRFVNPLLK